MKNITISIWRPSIVGTALILSIPILTIAISVFEPPGENWQHLKDTVLKEYIVNSMLLTCGYWDITDWSIDGLADSHV